MAITSKRNCWWWKLNINRTLNCVLMKNFCLKSRQGWNVLSNWRLIYPQKYIQVGLNSNFSVKQVYTDPERAFVIKGRTTVSILTTLVEERQRLANFYGIWQRLLLLLIFSIRFCFICPKKNLIRDKKNYLTFFRIITSTNKSVKIQLLYQLKKFFLFNLFCSVLFFYFKKQNEIRF